MGNEHSQLKGLKIDEKALEVTDHYTLNEGQIPPPASTSSSTSSKKQKHETAGRGQEPPAIRQVFAIFSCDSGVANGFVINNQPPLARAIQCMKIYRYEKFYLAIRRFYVLKFRFQAPKYIKICNFMASWRPELLSYRAVSPADYCFAQLE